MIDPKERNRVRDFGRRLALGSWLVAIVLAAAFVAAG